MLNGYIDFIAGNMVAGWVRDDAAPGADLFVEVTIPSGARVLTRANILREDPVTGGQARCGFKAVFPEQTSSLIRRAFGVSKKAFKRAVGNLYKNRKITLEKDGIRLNN